MAASRIRLSAIPLRVTLVLALVALAALGLLASGIAVTSALQQSLTERADEQLHEAARSMARPRAPRPPLQADARRPPSQFFVLIKPANGGSPGIVYDRDPTVSPSLPARPGSRPVTVPSLGGSSVMWRTLTITTPEGSTTVALRLTENRETVRRLIMLQLVIGAIVLAVLGMAAYFVIRRSLRPLREVESTAAAIAAGDLHRRVPVRGNNTEVDRLAQALNGMLAQIQRGFAATEASEEAARRSEEAARGSEEKMRRFIADASHELRTPLTTIRGFAELYRQGATDDAAMLLSRIEQESARMGVLVEDLLMLARLDAQRPLEFQPVDLLALASDAVHSAQAAAAARDGAALPAGDDAAAGPGTSPPRREIKLELAGGTGTMEVSGDAVRLRQVLANLLSNALVHTPATAAVTVRLTPLPDEVQIAVADTGPGLPPAQAARVFERFYRTDESRTRLSGGTGLGLSIVRALVLAHRGTVGVTSQPGVGTTFTVRLPRDPLRQPGTLAP